MWILAKGWMSGRLMAYREVMKIAKPQSGSRGLWIGTAKFNRSAVLLNHRRANIPSDIPIDSLRRHTPAK